MLHTKLIKMTKTLKTNHLKRVISMIYIEVLAVVVIWLSFWSLIPRDEWWFRGADFPRLQILFIGLIALIGMLFYRPNGTYGVSFCLRYSSQRLPTNLKWFYRIRCFGKTG